MLAAAGVDLEGRARPTRAAATTPSATGFATYTHLRGASDRAIAHQTRHRSIATVGTYVRIHDAWTDNAATMLGP